MIYTYIINPLLKHLIFQSTGRLHKNHEATYLIHKRLISGLHHTHPLLNHTHTSMI